MIDRATFFDGVRERLFRGTLSQYQVDGMNEILDEWEKRGLTDLRWLAYMLATVKWETAHTMQPIPEWGKGRGHSYGVPDPITGKAYYGRGFVQLTWKANYHAMGEILDAPLVADPELALDLDVATQILFEGMIRGSFTGRSLGQYFNDPTSDWVGARKIINGTDRAEEIADIGRAFHAVLESASKAVV